jgi:uncharacterized protein YqkB
MQPVISKKNNPKRNGMLQSSYAGKKGLYNMEIILTAAAAEKIKDRTSGRDGYLKLKYDTDGCGCAVNGVIALWFVPEIEDHDMAIETNDRPIYVEKAKIVFFDEHMKIDFSKETNSFQLKSPSEILNGRMSLIVKEKTD